MAEMEQAAGLGLLSQTFAPCKKSLHEKNQINILNAFSDLFVKLIHLKKKTIKEENRTLK